MTTSLSPLILRRVRTIAPTRQQKPLHAVPHGTDAMENAQRSAYQSARTRDGRLHPLPLTEAQAWAEATLITSHPPAKKATP